MSGSLRKRSKGSWEIYLDAGSDPGTGRRLRHYETIKGTKREAKQRLAELEVSIEKGRVLGKFLLSILHSLLMKRISLNGTERTSVACATDVILLATWFAIS